MDFLLLRGDYDVESAGKSLQFLFDFVGNGDGSREISQVFAGQILVGFFPAAEMDFDFDFVAFGQEFFGLVLLEFQIVLVGPDAQADAFDLGFFLLGFVLAVFPGFLVLVFAEVHDFADRRDGFGGDLDQVGASFFGQSDRLRHAHNTQLLAVFANNPGFFGPDVFINPGSQLLLFRLGPAVCASYLFEINC
jgi:hypothetical protein